MTVTPKIVDDAILAALRGDATITSWKGAVESVDAIQRIMTTKKTKYPLIMVEYDGSPKGTGPGSGGSTGSGAQFKIEGSWFINVADKNLRGEADSRKGIASKVTQPGTMDMIEHIKTLLLFKNLGVAGLGRFSYAGEGAVIVPWDLKVPGFRIKIINDWFTTGKAD